MTAIDTAIDRISDEPASVQGRLAPLSDAPSPGTAWGGWLIGLLLPVGLAIAWEAAVRFGLAEGRLMPPPSRIFATLWELAASGELLRHIVTTSARVFGGFLIGVLAGTLIGAISGYSGLVKKLVDPTLQGLRLIPSIAWVPLFLLWLGIFEASKVALIAVGVFFPVYLGVMGAIASVDRKFVEVGRIFRLSGPQLVTRILLPAILPAYVLSLRGGLGLGWSAISALRNRRRASEPRSPRSVSKITATAGRANYPAVRASAGPSPVRSCPGPACCCWTNRSLHSMPLRASTCRRTCSTCGPMPGRHCCSSPTTSTKPCCSPTGSW